MDIARQYVKQFMNESAKKEVKPAAKSLRSESIALPTFEADEWTFNPKDMGMSGVATYCCPHKISITEDLVESEASIMGHPLISDIAGTEPEEQMFCLIYDYGDPDMSFGYHFSVWVDDNELMVYDYASSMEELKQKLEADFLPYTNLDPASIPYDQFANKIASMEVAESAPVNEDSKMYTFSMEVPVTITVMADSEELARELLKKESEVEFDLSEVEFARGDAELRWMGLPADVVEMAEVSMFDPSK